nr:glycosyltransferase family 2 protein [Leisingera sp. HS039]
MVTAASHGIDPARVVVLIPTLNEADQIEKILHEIIDGDPVASRCPVVVADGGSQDETCAIVTGMMGRYPNLQLVHNPGRTQAAAMNLLLQPEFDRFGIAIRCDAHAAYPPGYVSGLTRCLTGKEADSVVVPMDATASSGGCFQRGLVWVADSWLGAGGSPHRGGVVSGYCNHGHHAAFQMSSFRLLNGYDTDFKANEDAEYDLRLVRQGGRIWLNADMRIGYFPRQSAGRLWKQYWNYGAGRAQTCLKHRIRPGVRQLIPAVHTVLVLLSLLAVPVTRLPLVWLFIYGIAILCSGLRAAWIHRSVCGLSGSLALATMHLAWGLGFLSRLMKARQKANRHMMAKETL